MAGHSKWANIQHRKNRQDERKGKTFGKLIKEVTVAAKIGGEDVATNPRLRLAVDKAKEANLPKEKVRDAIKRGTGQLDGIVYEEIRYEGYGPHGVAFLVDCLTDNKMRTVAEVRHVFNKNGGNLGTDGSVSYLFRFCSQFFLDESHEKEEELIELLIELGVNDINLIGDKGIEVLGDPDSYLEIKKNLLEKGYQIVLDEVLMLPKELLIIQSENLESVHKLKYVLESLDDVQNVYVNIEE
jgi:YebC/PmpR family DNA-binding regulatory protein